MLTAAVMQPYFFPYAGYFRLFAASDVFIIYDCVQFPRRGFVHRCHVPGPAGGQEWLTLPLAHQPRAALINQLGFAPDARAELDRRIARHDWLAGGGTPAACATRQFLASPLFGVVDFLEDGLRLVTGLLEFRTRMLRSSTLPISPRLRGEDRIIAILKAVGATSYVNAPGGRALYAPERFAAEGITLNFLTPYDGPHRMLLHDLMTGDPAAIASGVRRRTVLER